MVCARARVTPCQSRRSRPTTPSRRSRTSPPPPGPSRRTCPAPRSATRPPPARLRRRHAAAAAAGRPARPELVSELAVDRAVSFRPGARLSVPLCLARPRLSVAATRRPAVAEELVHKYAQTTPPPAQIAERCVVHVHFDICNTTSRRAGRMGVSGVLRVAGPRAERRPRHVTNWGP